MEALSPVERSIIYSAIAFSIVFIVLGLLTGVIYAVRFVAGEKPKTPGPSAEKSPSVSAPVPVAVPAPVSAPVSGGARHVAAIAAASLAVTQGRGKILGVVPEGAAKPLYPDTTQRWRAAAVAEGSGRCLRRTWGR
jgi:Na+-transporting methylmalonyl-CoA/oxaloacetate decarboxylase gamma subunit